MMVDAVAVQFAAATRSLSRCLSVDLWPGSEHAVRSLSLLAPNLAARPGLIRRPCSLGADDLVLSFVSHGMPPGACARIRNGDMYDLPSVSIHRELLLPLPPPRPVPQLASVVLDSGAAGAAVVPPAPAAAPADAPLVVPAPMAARKRSLHLERSGGGQHLTANNKAQFENKQVIMRQKHQAKLVLIAAQHAADPSLVALYSLVRQRVDLGYPQPHVCTPADLNTCMHCLRHDEPAKLMRSACWGPDLPPVHASGWHKKVLTEIRWEAEAIDAAAVGLHVWPAAKATGYLVCSQCSLITTEGNRYRCHGIESCPAARRHASGPSAHAAPSAAVSCPPRALPRSARLASHEHVEIVVSGPLSALAAPSAAVSCLPRARPRSARLASHEHVEIDVSGPPSALAAPSAAAPCHSLARRRSARLASHEHVEIEVSGLSSAHAAPFSDSHALGAGPVP
jgi:hypothetical protein